MLEIVTRFVASHKCIKLFKQGISLSIAEIMSRISLVGLIIDAEERHIFPIN